MLPPFKKGDPTNMTLTESDLAQFTGSERWFRHSLCPNVLYTEGVQFLAERAGAYWLIDKIATLQGRPKIGAEDFQVWKLKLWNTDGPKDHDATLTCTDGDKGGGPVLLHNELITFTDFPLKEIELWVESDGQHHTILLPSEH